MRLARITIFAGHFGSGKSSLAVAYAMWARKHRAHVVLCDLDIVNPYFCSSNALQCLTEANIRLVASRYVNTNTDAPAIPAETRVLFDDKNVTGIIDLGGDNRGALAIGRYASFLQDKNEYEMLMVINRFRPLTSNIEDLLEMKEAIEAASRIAFTGIINNSNLMAETTLSNVLGTADYAEEASQKLSLPLKATSIEQRLIDNSGALELARQTVGNVFPLNLYAQSIKIK